MTKRKKERRGARGRLGAHYRPTRPPLKKKKHIFSKKQPWKATRILTSFRPGAKGEHLGGSVKKRKKKGKEAFRRKKEKISSFPTHCDLKTSHHRLQKRMNSSGGGEV